nr:DUF2071 domain-containing protein [uncultured Flavobacterium sp.]
MEKKTISEILKSVSHRTWENPKKSWNFYQEWNKAIFMHWEIDKEILIDFLPKNLEIDTFNNKAWISLVAFTMEKIRPKNLPYFPPISNFLEINLRTYVKKDNKPGVYFLNIEAEKFLSAFIARSISGLPYQKSNIKHDIKKGMFQSNFESKKFNLNIEYQVGDLQKNKTDLDVFLTERYCLYLEKNNRLIRYEIHHLPWKIHYIKIDNLITNYQIGDKISLKLKPNLVHYSKGIQVIAWNKEYLT